MAHIFRALATKNNTLDSHGGALGTSEYLSHERIRFSGMKIGAATCALGDARSARLEINSPAIEPTNKQRGGINDAH